MLGNIPVLFGNGAQVIFNGNTGRGPYHIQNGLGGIGQFAFNIGFDGFLNESIYDSAANREREDKHR